MKRLVVLVIAFSVLFCGCTKKSEVPPQINDGSRASIWVSFSEINAMLLSEKGFKSEFSSLMDNCEKIGTDDVYVHIRSYCDSLFKSEYFPLSDEAKGYDYDVFEYIVSEIHSREMRVHAWINPYRVLSSSEDVNALSEDNPAYIWLNDDSPDNDKNVCFANGIYLNPAESEVRTLVINGIRETIQNYDVDGIHFDDYFYPTTSADFDSLSYEQYISKTESPLPLADWRRANVNSLISGCYTAIKFTDKNIEFSISPAASIEKNYTEFYADISAWLKNGCVDVIMPQLYFGFEYPAEEYRFENLLNKWKSFCEINKDTKLMIGLAAYKIGTDSPQDTEEWCSYDDIIARQAELCISDESISGYALFSATAVFSADELNTRQRENLIGVINA